MINLSGCARAQSQLDAFEDGELAHEEKRRVQLHLDSCAACRATLKQRQGELSLMRSALSEHPRIAAPPGFDVMVWRSIEQRAQLRPKTLRARLSEFVLRPVPRLLGSAMFGLLSALAFGHMATSGSVARLSLSPWAQTVAAPPAASAWPGDSQALLLAMEQRREMAALRFDFGELPRAPQVLEAEPQPGAAHERRSSENSSWTRPALPSRAASSSDAGSLC